MARLPEGIIIDSEKTFGELRFAAMRREVYETNDDGTVSNEVKERTYDLKCRVQGMDIAVSIPAGVPPLDFKYNELVKLVNPICGTVTSREAGQVRVNWYIKADNIVKADAPTAPSGGGNSGKPPAQSQQNDKK